MGFRDVKVGDEVTRWTFDRTSGVEVDKEIGWGPQYGVTGSYLVREGEHER